MPTTDTSERGLESIIVQALIDEAGYVPGEPGDYDREVALDVPKLLSFLQATQPEAVERLGIEQDGPARRKFLARLQGEITKRGIVDILRRGVQHGPAAVELLYGTPSPDNAGAVALNAANVFSVTRQLRYSRDETRLALDLVLFINGLPVVTFELKNRLTKQTVADAEQQYKRDRDPRELLFQFGRCLVHFAVDDQRVRFCTHLQADKSVFLPFDKGYRDGAGNPPNPDGLATDYLWRETLSRAGLTDIIENYAQIVEDKEEDAGGRKKRKLIFPRYHQLDVVHRLLADARETGPGRRYLIQHSAGSGKSNSIAWLAHQLVGLERGSRPAFDSVVVVTDRRVLDAQIRDTVRQFAQVDNIVGHAEHSRDLRRYLEGGKKIIITTVQKFPVILDAIGSDHRGRSFAILIDEAHSSQGSRTAAKMNVVLSATGETEEEEETLEDIINRVIQQRKMLSNASYFAFTATPKNRTLEVFGDPVPEGDKVGHAPFHSYTMKQAIQEGFILDVLEHYTPVLSFYRLAKAVEEDPKFDVKRARKKLRRYVEEHEHAIRVKAEIMVDHFHDEVLAARKIGGKARAMVVTGSIARAIEYYHAIESYLRERKSPYRAIVAFSGEHDYGGRQVTEASLNGFASGKIPKSIREDPYRFLVCADKFQTGYDEPLLHTMYVDKQLAGVKAVQTLSRLNRSHPQKHDTFVLDFMNDPDIIQASFDPYYRTTILSEETDPDKLHDLKADLDAHQVYSATDVDCLVAVYLAGGDREAMEPILERCVAAYVGNLDEDAQVDFKGKAKAFLRMYGFLGAILSYASPGWEKLSIALEFLVPKLPAPVEDDLSAGILDAIDMDSYRAEKLAVARVKLTDEDGEVGPVPAGGGGGKPEPELELLSNIIKAFNDQFGAGDWSDRDKVADVVAREVPQKVAQDAAYRNAMANSDEQNARIEHDRAVERVIISLLADHSELYRQYTSDPEFKRWVREQSFRQTYRPPDAAPPARGIARH